MKLSKLLFVGAFVISSLTKIIASDLINEDLKPSTKPLIQEGIFNFVGENYIQRKNEVINEFKSFFLSEYQTKLSVDKIKKIKKISESYDNLDDILKAVFKFQDGKVTTSITSGDEELFNEIFFTSRVITPYSYARSPLFSDFSYLQNDVFYFFYDVIRTEMDQNEGEKTPDALKMISVAKNFKNFINEIVDAFDKVKKTECSVRFKPDEVLIQEPKSAGLLQRAEPSFSSANQF